MEKITETNHSETINQINILADQVADLTVQVDDLDFQLKRIKGSLLWKLSSPLRKIIHFVSRQLTRIKNTGSLRGFHDKLHQIHREKKVRRLFGTRSFPDATEREKQRTTKFRRMVKVSILVPLFNTPPRYLRAMIDSVIAQTYLDWELCLADGSDEKHGKVGEICREYGKNDARIRYRLLTENEGISGNTNRAMEMAKGDFIGLLDHDDVLHPEALFAYVTAINEQNADYLYCDEATFRGRRIDNMITLHFKPDFAIDNLRANNYICHMSVFDRQLLEGMELFRSQFDGSQDHDMILRLTKAAKCVVHVPRILYYWRSHRGSAAYDINVKPYAVTAAKGAISAHLRACGFDNFRISSTRAYANIFKIAYRITDAPLISIIIANKDHTDDLRGLIDSIITKSTYRNYEIIIVENNSVTEDIFAYYEELKDNPQIRVITFPTAFNFSAINNFGATQAHGEYLLFLNNDTEVLRVNWLEEMLMYAQREDVACVGAKLYYPDKTIQHAGVVLGLGAHRTAGHSHYRQHRENLGYMGRLCYAQNVTAVTAACLMVAKYLFDEVGGFDEEFAVSLNDVDLCLKLRAKGYLNVFTPFAELYHYESRSRGLDLDGENARRYEAESVRFRSKWAEELAAGDPYYNPNFSLDKSDFSLRIAK
ncbi:MAG: glycosyltransferase family 2 protein [Lachnospiraceae bacterium]|jgi:GT2 family glycosyltransferase|nr:glycosyltransferase family 2 protein [Lachnospiraceae bacterium]